MAGEVGEQSSGSGSTYEALQAGGDAACPHGGAVGTGGGAVAGGRVVGARVVVLGGAL
jgi:hypothetical protein